MYLRTFPLSSLFGCRDLTVQSERDAMIGWDSTYFEFAMGVVCGVPPQLMEPQFNSVRELAHFPPTVRVVATGAHCPRERGQVEDTHLPSDISSRFFVFFLPTFHENFKFLKNCPYDFHKILRSHSTSKGAPACAKASKSYDWNVRNMAKISPKVAKINPKTAIFRFFFQFSQKLSIRFEQKFLQSFSTP